MSIRAVATLVFLVIFPVILASGQTKCSAPDSYDLSEAGKRAYAALQSETLFALGGIGYSGETSEGENALRVLLDESSSESAFLKLSNSDAGAGGLYGMIGLKTLKSSCFDDAYKAYSRLASKAETKGRHGKLAPGEVGYMVGCVYSVHKRREVAKDLFNGKLDIWVRSLESQIPRRATEE